MISWSQKSSNCDEEQEHELTSSIKSLTANKTVASNQQDEDRLQVENEFNRMGFNNDSIWRISDMNKNFELCNTYPRYLILPASFADQDLESVAKFRYFNRLPTAVWRHSKNGCFIVRSSQPTVGWFGWFRSDLDETLVQSYVSNTMPFNSIANQMLVNLDEDGNPAANTNDQTSVDNTSIDKNSREREVSQPQPQSAPTFSTTLSQHLLGHQTNLIFNNIYEAMMMTTTTPTVTTTTTNNSTTTAITTTNSSSSSPTIQSQLNSGDSAACTSQSTTTPNLVDSDSSSNLAKSTTNLSMISNGNITTSTTTSNFEISNSAITESSETNATTQSASTSPSSKMIIIDARSYTAAMANRAKGGGCECSEYYLRCEVQFMNLANIHSIRKSFHAIRSVCEAYSEQSNNWLNFLDNSRWLHHISGLIKSALLIVDAIDIEEKSILIHCSDGWDRTPQLVALAELMLDPHYRTFDGFKTLIQREWLDFGHKFADRCGSNPCNEDPNERCPVFLQWLDCVQQILVQFPKNFEFNALYLDKLNRHTYSNVFGTFSHNSTQERILGRVDERMLSLWSYFDSSRRKFRNDRYIKSDEILRPSYKVRDLHFWKEVYLPPLNRNQSPYMPTSISNNIDNKKFHDSLYIDGLKRTVCK